MSKFLGPFQNWHSNGENAWYLKKWMSFTIFYYVCCTKYWWMHTVYSTSRSQTHLYSPNLNFSVQCWWHKDCTELPMTLMEELGIDGSVFHCFVRKLQYYKITIGCKSQNDIKKVWLWQRGQSVEWSGSNAMFFSISLLKQSLPGTY